MQNHNEESITAHDSVESSEPSSQSSSEQQSQPLNNIRNGLLNPKTLQLLENRANLLSESFNHLIGSLQTSMYAKSAITLQHIELYRNTVDKFCTDVHESIDSMESFMNRLNDLNQELKQMRNLYHNIKELRKTVEIIQHNVNTHQQNPSLIFLSSPAGEQETSNRNDDEAPQEQN
ncbi:hypothetical protein FDP41_007712 [Naegleria fowleri]|uniref:BLOC-1-related complex subunit 6 C-terminal helix domain-containing protein n=1 Tax=Naegleria fowleri TaxID=5763 RepID=A0A6A5C359_NAEFO|nr:uncharacterized protein FDP41_007712 [Naegleria fowleri]KAF0983797.1 hypothetical protein FDP41_007712 [Naegleria fowleri]CAG4713203.1 unnamed protein product [Naegleria fowleri]